MSPYISIFPDFVKIVFSRVNKYAKWFQNCSATFDIPKWNNSCFSNNEFCHDNLYKIKVQL